MNRMRKGLTRALDSISRWLSSEKWVRHSLRARTLGFAPHPDEELLGCGGTIVLKVRSGAAVAVVIMTDGRTSHRRFVGEAELIRMREEEARVAARRLGLGEDAYSFLRFADDTLQDAIDAASKTIRGIIERFQPEEIFVPHRRDGLRDHVATHCAVLAALKGYPRKVIVMEYPVWLRHTWPWTWGFTRGRGFWGRLGCAIADVVALTVGCRTHVDIHSVVQTKRYALAAYRSQVERPDDSPEWPILADVSKGDFLRCFEQPREIFRRTEHSG